MRTQVIIRLCCPPCDGVTGLIKGCPNTGVMQELIRLCCPPCHGVTGLIKGCPNTRVMQELLLGKLALSIRSIELR